MGFVTVEAKDGQEAVDAVRESKAQLRAVLLDVTMPKLDGREVYEQIREHSPELPVLIMSGYSQRRS